LVSIYLKKENTDEAKKYLQKIINEKYPSAKKANEILKQL